MCLTLLSAHCGQCGGELFSSGTEDKKFQIRPGTELLDLYEKICDSLYYFATGRCTL